jgi:hypothetical protein
MLAEVVGQPHPTVMPLTKQLIEQAEREKLEELEAPVAPAGSRSGEGANSILPHLTRSLKAKPASHSEESTNSNPDKPSR